MSATYETAKKLVLTLQREGFTAYFAGGWVRDFLMGHPSSDIDIATDAPPEKILDIFPRTIEVGLQFGVIIVAVDNHQFEIATFRKDIDYQDGRKPTKIEPSTPIEDASRRDFTINGMFYDPITEEIHDYVGGQKDIQHQIIRTIGDPNERFYEDRLRMIRAVRFAERFQFHLDPETEQAIVDNAPTLFPSVSMERIWQEINKMVEYQNVDQAILTLARTGLLGVIFPDLANSHLNAIKQATQRYRHYPQESPTIAYIMELFPEITLHSMVELCRYLKTSNREIRFLESFFKCKELVDSGDPNLQLWSYVYGDPFGRKSLQIIAARFSEEERTRFLEFHEKQQRKLQKHIARIQNKTPVVTSEALKKHGILPGKIMGTLLREAESLSINKNLEDPEVIIQALKQGPLWPK